MLGTLRWRATHASLRNKWWYIVLPIRLQSEVSIIKMHEGVYANNPISATIAGNEICVSQPAIHLGFISMPNERLCDSAQGLNGVGAIGLGSWFDHQTLIARHVNVDSLSGVHWTIIVTRYAFGSWDEREASNELKTWFLGSECALFTGKKNPFALVTSWCGVGVASALEMRDLMLAKMFPLHLKFPESVK